MHAKDASDSARVLRRGANLVLVPALIKTGMANRFSASQRTLPEHKGATRAQVALAWLLAQKPWIVPIPGTTRLHRLEENLGGARVALTRDELNAIHDVISAIHVQPDRYPSQMQSFVNR